jgi:hypothetical protein
MVEMLVVMSIELVEASKNAGWCPYKSCDEERQRSGGRKLLSEQILYEWRYRRAVAAV